MSTAVSTSCIFHPSRVVLRHLSDENRFHRHAVRDESLTSPRVCPPMTPQQVADASRLIGPARPGESVSYSRVSSCPEASVFTRTYLACSGLLHQMGAGRYFLAAGISAAVTNPLENFKAQIQTSPGNFIQTVRTILEKGVFRILTRGTTSAFIGGAVGRGAKVSAAKLLDGNMDYFPEGFRDVLRGVAAGTVYAIASGPFDWAKYTSYAGINASRGSMLRGWHPALFGLKIVYNGTFFPAQKFFEQVISEHCAPLSKGEKTFLASFLAGAMAATVSMPLDVSRSQLFMSTPRDPGLARPPLGSLFKGLLPKVVHQGAVQGVLWFLVHLAETMAKDAKAAEAH